jgi:tetratricopeptide (TPR) repeat protein
MILRRSKTNFFGCSVPELQRPPATTNIHVFYMMACDGHRLAGQPGAPPKEKFPKAKEAALKALEIDDTLGEAHSSLAIIKATYDWDWAGAEKEFQRAIQLNPGFAIAHDRYGVTLYRMGRVQEAIAEIKQALDLDPLSLPFNRDLGDAFYFARQYDQSIEQLQKTQALDPVESKSRIPRINFLF